MSCPAMKTKITLGKGEKRQRRGKIAGESPEKQRLRVTPGASFVAFYEHIYFSLALEMYL